MLKKWFVLLVMLFAAGTLTAAVTIGSVKWETDPGIAKKRAAAKKLPVVMLFTGSDWCPYCVRLEKNALRSPVFKKIQKNAVLLYLDFPRGKEQSAALKQQNRLLSKKYGVRGFPTTLVIGADGKIKGQIVGAPGNYLQRLQELLKK